MPIVARVLKEAHVKLLTGDGDRSSPVEFRKQQVKVGGLIPAPANLISRLISDLEKFINNDSSLPPLIKAGLAHVQFKTIHPFLDGNGRIGQLLIILILVRYKILTQSLLYLSYFFKKHHTEYYTKRDGVRTKGDFEGWIEYYLKAIVESAEDATKNARELEQLEKKILLDIQASSLCIRSLSDAHRFVSHLFKHPVVTIIDLSDKLNKPYNSIKQMVEKLGQLNILHKHSWTKRNKTYKFSKYIEL